MIRTHAQAAAVSVSPLETLEERFLREMVEIRSLSGEEREVAAYLAARMNEFGLDAFVDQAGNAVGRVSNPDSDGRVADIVLLGHMDTVPGDIPVRREGDTLHGRGAVDAKGPLAAFVVAASRARLPRGVRLVVVGAVEEECVTSKGARFVAPQYNPAAAIIGEPSAWDGIGLGYKGRILVEYMRRQHVNHTAVPRPSAADEFCHWWEAVRERAEGMRPGERAFERVQATLRSIRTSSDGLTDTVEAVAGFRLPPGVEPDDIEELCKAVSDEHVTLAFRGPEVAHVADRSNVVVRALSGAIRATGGKPHPKLKTGTCDLNVLGPIWRCPIAAYGPGDSTLDHTPNERLSMAEYVKSIEVLTHAVESIACELCPPY
ncbi:LysW-gamma-L-lysine/LysW-L-ornithine carboxypeptidase [Phycisphaerales bacterium]|nr:LysW-gamma-L-lysine/LysW-L-ornithine carboxypeptidase [Phycisphaerales bacterium]